MEEPADLLLELVKLVDGFGRPHVPHDPVIQHEVVCWVKGRTVVGVVVAEVTILESQHQLA